VVKIKVVEGEIIRVPCLVCNQSVKEMPLTSEWLKSVVCDDCRKLHKNDPCSVCGTEEGNKERPLYIQITNEWKIVKYCVRCSDVGKGFSYARSHRS
jgi:hypothetical protein